ncbi:MAG: hypothetical protein FWB95_03075 [Treponema sp.]|nr:hypothetical protein [Treponema sp.]
MNRMRFLLLFCVLLLCVTPVFTLGGKEKNAPRSLLDEGTTLSLTGNERQPPEGFGEIRHVTASGTVRLVGTGMFNDLVISGEHEWYIAKDDREKLHNLQQQSVAVEGDEAIIELKLLNNMGSIFRRELSNIKIISIRQ